MQRRRKILTENEIISAVKSRLREKRFMHTEGCVRMAEKLAEQYGADVNLARRAAWLHDIAKEMPYEDSLELVSGFALSDIQKSKKIIHAFTGAIIAEHDFGECEEVCDAIRWHTTAKAGMSLLSKIIWISDLPEEGRDFPGVSEIRELAFSDLRKALILGFDTTLSFLEEKGCEIDANMIEARMFEMSAGKGNINE
jgi:nicotinate-nucleotide adenylyltransferase